MGTVLVPYQAAGWLADAWRPDELTHVPEVGSGLPEVDIHAWEVAWGTASGGERVMLAVVRSLVDGSSVNLSELARLDGSNFALVVQALAQMWPVEEHPAGLEAD